MQDKESEMDLTRRRLGKTDLEVTPIGLGGAWLGCGRGGFDRDAAVATVRKALDLGINLVDTSDDYVGGRSEQAIGEALAAWLADGGKREDLVVSTKTGTRTRPRDLSAEGTRRSLTTSMQALRTDYLDVALVHDPENLDAVLAPGGAWEELKRMKAEGVVRAIGLGTRNHHHHHWMMATRQCDVILAYRDYNLLSQSLTGEVLPEAAWLGVGLLNGTAVIRGLLCGEDPRAVAERVNAEKGVPACHLPSPAETERAYGIWRRCGEIGVGMLAVALQFCMRETRLTSTLVGASSPAHVEAAVRAVGEDVPEQAWKTLGTEFGLLAARVP
jgi:D-threo-aldose 1-dehydrogenase